MSVCTSTIYTLCQQGLLPHVRIGIGRGTIRIDEHELEQFIERAKVTAGVASTNERRSSGRPFKHLDGERLRAAWRQQGADAP